MASWDYWPGRALTVSSLAPWTRATIYATQVYLRRFGHYLAGYNLDGIEGHQTRTAIQRYLKYRGYYGGLIDGDIGKMTFNAWCNCMQAQGYSIPWSNGSHPNHILIYSWARYLNARR